MAAFGVGSGGAGKASDPDRPRDDSESRLVAGASWQAFCTTLAGAGERILGSDFPDHASDRAEGFRHLSRLVVFALQSALEFSDPEFPTFHHFDDDVVKWGGPNVDNVYMRARVRGDLAYRITGTVAGVRELIISTHEGDMQLEEYGVYEERNLAQLTPASDGELHLTLSAIPQEGDWMPLHPQARYVTVRQYVSDWGDDRLADLRIERIGSEGLAPNRPTPAHVDEALRTAGEWVERSVCYWNKMLRRVRTSAADNSLGRPLAVAGGAADIRYGAGFWCLDPHEALLIEFTPPDARYWSVQLYSVAWFESLDFVNRQSSLSRESAHLDDDGVFRAVIAHRDPGVPNWLDTEGRREGVVAYRWAWSNDAPQPRARALPMDQIRSHLPPTTPAVDGEERRIRLAARQAAARRILRH